MRSADIRRWTQDEDQLLRTAIGKYGELSEPEPLYRDIINSSLD